MARDGDNKEKTIRCSFCNKAQSEVKTLIAGPGVYICDECIDLCSSIVEEESGKEAVDDKSDFALLKKPHEIKALLDEYVIGQEEAKKTLSVAVYNHYKRIYSGKKGDVEVGKSNILMLGPTGVGKTMLAQKIKKVAAEHGIYLYENVPLARKLYADVKINDYVPETMWSLVVTALKLAYEHKEKMNKR